jgi:hypothetical protein
VSNNDVIYIATDRLWVGRLKLYGGFNKFPNIERMAQHGTTYRNATSAAGSTVMCHSCEWTGKQSWELHCSDDYKNIKYNSPMPDQETVFSDMIKNGYECHIIMHDRPPDKYYSGYANCYGLWPDEVIRHPIIDEKDATREEQIMMAATIVDEARKNGKKAFVWIKCNGANQRRIHYLDYAGQKRVTREDLYNCEIDESIGSLLDHYNYPSKETPDIWFASDHGAFCGEGARFHYGYHLDQEIIHVPLVCSTRNEGQKDYTDVFSMKQLRFMLQGKPIVKEELVYAETLFPGQVRLRYDPHKYSMAKIMVRNQRYKYIYNSWGPDGWSEEPVEEFYDLVYDPHEKNNLADTFLGKYVDVARPNRNLPRQKTFSRIHPDEKCFERYRNSITEEEWASEGISSKELEWPQGVDWCKSLARTGWVHIYTLIEEFRAEAKKIWVETGREEAFVL